MPEEGLEEGRMGSEYLPVRRVRRKDEASDQEARPGQEESKAIRRGAMAKENGEIMPWGAGERARESWEDVTGRSRALRLRFQRNSKLEANNGVTREPVNYRQTSRLQVSNQGDRQGHPGSPTN